MIPKRQTISAHIKVALIKRVKRIAKRRQISLSKAFEFALEQYFGKTIPDSVTE